MRTPSTTPAPPSDSTTTTADLTEDELQREEIAAELRYLTTIAPPS